MVPGRPGRGPGPGGACQVGRGSGPAGGGAPIFSRGAAPPGPGPQYSAGARPRRGRGPVLWPGRGAPPGQTPGPGRPWIYPYCANCDDAILGKVKSRKSDQLFF